jgi:hypothetical protein
MQPTQSGIDYCNSDEYEVFMIRQAAKYKITGSPYHPDHIKMEIAKSEELLKIALAETL